MTKKSMPIEEIVPNMVTVHRDTDAEGNMTGWYDLSPGYDGPDVTIDVDEKYAGGAFEVPEGEEDHIYALIGPVSIGFYVPVGANTRKRINCAGGPGR